VWWKQTIREAVPRRPSSQEVGWRVVFEVGLSQAGRRSGHIVENVVRARRVRVGLVVGSALRE
jgi:hypothetical protein